MSLHYLKALWRRLPRRFRRAAMTEIAARLVRKPGPPPARSQGVVIAGDIEGESGLAESARCLAQVIGLAGLSRGVMRLGLPGVVAAERNIIAPDAALLAVVNAPFLPVALLRAPRELVVGRRVIGAWAWELPVVPASWRRGADFVHEIWAPSAFTAAALECLAPGKVRVVPHPLAAAALPALGDRVMFGLPADRVIILTVFNLASSMVRKNPLGTIAAFKAAFGEAADYLLVLKLSHVAYYKADLEMIRAAIGPAKNIRLIVDNWPEPQLRGLIAACDIVLSLHRSEGFGLIPATAMLLGRPVVATGWSGTLTFMSADTARLVAYRLVPVCDPRGVYELPDAVWAEPDVEDAAAALRALADNRVLREDLGRLGQDYARAKLGQGPVLAALAASGIA